MTRERREDILLAAVVVSLVLHVAIMFVVKGRVMSTGVEEKFLPRQRPAARFEREHKVQDLLKIAEIKDLVARREAPAAAAAEKLVPDLDSAKDPSHLPVADPPSAEVAPAPEPRFENFAYTPVKVATAPAMPEKMPTETPSARILAAAPDAGPRLPGKMDEFKPTATAAAALPSPAPALRVNPAADDDKQDEKEEAPAFKPTDTVFEKVDKAVVEAERRAVMDLLNVPSAAELSEFAKVEVVSAQDEDWRYFKLKVSPTGALAVVPKDFVLLLDASGSIGSERMSSLRRAAKSILSTAMNSGDRFNLVAFRNRYSYAFRTWRECTKTSFDAAHRWLDDLAAYGRTDVFATIESVLTLPRDPARPLIALVVTDGDANSGFTSTAEIISRFTELNDGLVSVYMYGVKKEANVELIDVLTRGNRGESFVHKGSRRTSGRGLSFLTDRFRDPVLTDMRIVFASGCPAEFYPRRIKNVYAGGYTEVTGRVPRNVDELRFSLRGLNGASSYESFFSVPLADTRFDASAATCFYEEKRTDAKLKGDAR